MNTSLTVIFVLFLIFLFFNIIIRRRKINKRSETLAIQIISQHKATLGVECLHKLKRDSYGTEQPEKWHKEIRYFFNTQLSFLKHYKYNQFYAFCFQIVDKIGRIERNNLLNNEGKYSNSKFDDKADSFKDYCRNILEEKNWNIFFQDDNIVDFIATKNNMKIVAICKFYQRSIDKNAVQQASFAKSHYNADIAVVIANQDYSDAAKSLAQTLEVSLWDYRQLPYKAEEL